MLELNLGVIMRIMSVVLVGSLLFHPLLLEVRLNVDSVRFFFVNSQAKEQSHQVHLIYHRME